MTDAQDNAISLAQTRLSSLDGAQEQSLFINDDGIAVLDFRLVFPSGPLVVDTPRQRDGRDVSSILIGEDGEVHHFFLRMPPLPVDDYEYASLTSRVFDMANGSIDSTYLEVYISAGYEDYPQEAWWPHVRPTAGVSPPIIAPEVLMPSLRTFFENYCNLFR
jgi:hypothetical protein